jgi:hypothetical protein
MHKVLMSDAISSVYFCLLSVLLVSYPMPGSYAVFYDFLVLGLMLGLQSILSYCCMAYNEGLTSCFACRKQFSQCCFWKRLFSPHWMGLTIVSKTIWPHMQGLIFGLSGLLHWPICLSLCQFHTVLLTIALEYVLKLGSGNSSTLF